MMRYMQQLIGCLGCASIFFLASCQKKQEPFLYVLYNPSADPIIVNRDFKGPPPGASAGWSTEIKPGRYSVLRVNTPPFAFTCLRHQLTRYISVSCDQVLQITRREAPPLRPGEPDGSYWLVENRKS